MARVYRGVDRHVAREASEATVAKAEELAVRARNRLSQHRETGSAHVEVSAGRRSDAFVELVDPAALSIEFGRSADSQRGAMQGIYPLSYAIGAHRG